MSIQAERDPHQTTDHRAEAARHRSLADRLGRDGYRDQAARHLLEARLHDLKAAATGLDSQAA